MRFKASDKVELDRLLIKINNAELTCDQMDDQRQFTCQGPHQPIGQKVTFEVFDKLSGEILGSAEISFYSIIPTSTLSPTNPPPFNPDDPRPVPIVPYLGGGK